MSRQLVIRSSDKVSGSNNNAEFHVQWDNFLPKAEKYQVSFQVNSQGNYVDNAAMEFDSTYAETELTGAVSGFTFPANEVLTAAIEPSMPNMLDDGTNIINTAIYTGEPGITKSVVSGQSYGKLNGDYYLTGSRFGGSTFNSYKPEFPFTDDATYWAPRPAYNTSGIYTGFQNGNPQKLSTTVSINGTPTIIEGEYLQFQLPNALILKEYYLKHYTNILTSARKWYIAGSNDGTSWTLVDQQTGQSPNMTTNLYPTYTTGSSTYYTYFRMIITETNNSSLFVYLWKITFYDILSESETYPLTTNSTIQTADIWADFGSKLYSNIRLVGSLYKKENGMMCGFLDNVPITMFQPSTKIKFSFRNKDTLSLYKQSGDLVGADIQTYLCGTDSDGNLLEDMHPYTMTMYIHPV